MKAGFGKHDITPAVGVELAGYGAFLGRKSTGIHDNLYCNVLILENKDDYAVIISCDLICLKGSLIEKIKKRIFKKFGYRKEKILIGGTHTHSGPSTGGYIGWGEEDKDYILSLPVKISNAMEKAKNNLKDIEIGVGSIKIEGEKISYNRVKEEIGVNNEIKILKIVEKGNKKPKCLILNYGAHGVVQGPANTLISRDWPGKAVDLIKEKTGFEVLFFQGGCGDINSKPSVCKNPENGFKEIEEIGKFFADAVIRKIDYIRTENIKKFRSKYFEIELPVVLISKDELKKIIKENQEILKKDKDTNKKNLAKFQIEGCKKQLLIYKKKESLDKMKVGIHVIEINNGILITCPGELFVEFQRKFENSFNKKIVFVLTYTGGSIPYIPSKYDFQVKGYASNFTPRIFGVMPFKEDVGDIFVENIVKEIKKWESNY